MKLFTLNVCDCVSHYMITPYITYTYTQPAPKEPAPSSRPTTPAKPGATGYKSITELSASFVRFLKNSPNQEIPLKYALLHGVCIGIYISLVLFRTFQQKFQSFYHRSGFRVSDYLPGNATTRDLIDACDGVKVTNYVKS